MSSQSALEVQDLARWFDVSAPWLTRVLERKPKRVLKAVDGVSFSVPRGSTFAIVGRERLRQVDHRAVGRRSPQSDTRRTELRPMAPAGTVACARR